MFSLSGLKDLVEVLLYSCVFLSTRVPRLCTMVFWWMETIKIINASQAKSINKFLNTKLQLLNCNANIYFNKTCLEQNLEPKYTKVKIHSHSKAVTKRMKAQVQKLRIKNEIKFIYATYKVFLLCRRSS
jgi:hypothetical protein